MRHALSLIGTRKRINAQTRRNGSTPLRLSKRGVILSFLMARKLWVPNLIAANHEAIAHLIRRSITRAGQYDNRNPRGKSLKRQRACRSLHLFRIAYKILILQAEVLKFQRIVQAPIPWKAYLAHENHRRGADPLHSFRHCVALQSVAVVVVSRQRDNPHMASAH